MMKLIFPDAILDQHLVVLGKTGAGKSSALRHIVEHLLSQKKRVCVIDPKGDWNGLKVSADGKGAGFPVILFGNFKETAGQPIPADVPLNEFSGKHVAELVTSGNRPCVIGFRGWTQGQMHRFWIDFASTIFNSNEGEFYLIIDEVHNFAPKGKIMSPEVGTCLHWTNRIMNEGRGIGLVNLIASQRPQKVHNDTLTACETLVAMRVIHKADRDAVEDWIKGCGDMAVGKDVLNSLAGMVRGEAYVWAPEVKFGPKRLTFPMFTTFDSFAPPQLQKKVSGKDWASVDLDEVKVKLAAVIEKAKATDPKELQKKVNEGLKQIRDLTAELEREKSKKPAATRTEIKTVEKRIMAVQSINRLEGLLDKASAIPVVVEEIRAAIREGKELNAANVITAPPPTPAPSSLRARQTEGYVPPVPHRQLAAQLDRHETNGDGALAKGPLKLLRSIVQFGRVTRDQLTLLSGYTQSSRDTYLKVLSSGGLVVYPGRGEVEATEAGREAAGEVDALPTGKDLIDWWLARLPSGHARVFQAVVSEDGQPISRQRITELTGYTQSSRDTYIKKLKTRKLIIIPSPGMIAPAGFLFQ